MCGLLSVGTVIDSVHRIFKSLTWFSVPSLVRPTSSTFLQSSYKDKERNRPYYLYVLSFFIYSVRYSEVDVVAVL